MKALSCIVVTSGVALVVEIDGLETVAQLKEEIKEQMRWSFAAEFLTLYVAKKDDHWLKASDLNFSLLLNGKIPDAIRAIMTEDGEMDPQYLVRNEAFGFPDEQDATTDDFHVLVGVPQLFKRILHYERTFFLSWLLLFCLWFVGF